jgi:hypothetical protein
VIEDRLKLGQVVNPVGLVISGPKKLGPDRLLQLKDTKGRVLPFANDLGRKTKGKRHSTDACGRPVLRPPLKASHARNEQKVSALVGLQFNGKRDTYENQTVLRREPAEFCPALNDPHAICRLLPAVPAVAAAGTRGTGGLLLGHVHLEGSAVHLGAVEGTFGLLSFVG